MIGINEEVLDKIIKVNKIYMETIKTSSFKIINSINNLEDSYDGVTLNGIVGIPKTQINNIKKIVNVINSYSEVLNDVKTGYKNQSASIKNYMINANSKFN